MLSKRKIQQSAMAFYLFREEYDKALSGWENYIKWRELSGVIVSHPIIVLDIINVFENLRTAKKENIMLVANLEGITERSLYV